MSKDKYSRNHGDSPFGKYGSKAMQTWKIVLMENEG